MWCYNALERLRAQFYFNCSAVYPFVFVKQSLSNVGRLFYIWDSEMGWDQKCGWTIARWLIILMGSMTCEKSLMGPPWVGQKHIFPPFKQTPLYMVQLGRISTIGSHRLKCVLIRPNGSKLVRMSPNWANRLKLISSNWLYCFRIMPGTMFSGRH